MTESQTLYELMCRAPAVPERFQPDMTAHAPNGIPDPTKWSSDEWYALQQAEKSLQWPSYYAREVLKRGEGEKDSAPIIFESTRVIEAIP